MPYRPLTGSLNYQSCFFNKTGPGPGFAPLKKRGYLAYFPGMIQAENEVCRLFKVNRIKPRGQGGKKLPGFCWTCLNSGLSPAGLFLTDFSALFNSVIINP